MNVSSFRHCCGFSVDPRHERCVAQKAPSLLEDLHCCCGSKLLFPLQPTLPFFAVDQISSFSPRLELANGAVPTLGKPPSRRDGHFFFLLIFGRALSLAAGASVTLTDTLYGLLLLFSFKVPRQGEGPSPPSCRPSPKRFSPLFKHLLPEGAVSFFPLFQRFLMKGVFFLFPLTPGEGCHRLR